MRFFKAINIFWKTLCSSEELLEDIPKKLEDKCEVEKVEPEKNEVLDSKFFVDGSIYTLALLQREGRLIDFLMEDLSAFSDEQIGVAVRQIHLDTSAGLKKYFDISSIVKENEGEKINVPSDFDPSVYNLTGSVPAEPPFNGFINHKGWKVEKTNFPTRSEKINTKIVQSTEIEIR